MNKFIILIFLKLIGFAQLTNAQVKWVSWEEGVKLTDTNARPIIIDVFTDWCGWCKKLDATTFKATAIAKTLSERFNCIKLNAEENRTFYFKDKTFKFDSNYKANELALSLLGAKMSYPSIVFLDEKFNLITVVQGFQTADEFKVILSYIADKHYLNTPWEEFSKQANAKTE